ncbi:2-dehydro-3-deoxyphosphogluconate aldolase/(4S)-4-hydroxy-2-oxoglutarate aldolase [Halopolyspora algeriensis]|uniref:2-dehydro-3-deoxy-phosphogluconate aldolase n=1 Tax=Halopolyspora algeriensis TaxID=1500506 RepID=A0A368VTX5_9ACTN|nr:bifunctional 4-hydroxy-2-oxoglutarate aldolase/2-dehydro-3-deoxy-phosphogluconate aldolase [Halopolyspora algeriensis]RCW44027.1 2-dehydro-3-deoxyphosphogluconate aldolase/(4S)-4-hydroxy-2-oxoglutarate aldolase [Halopolyspora algeriensis]TQM53470.1 2-dehydro-3-deoxyphosphogluconate aldolase/(4S)-4-hydroxy-2-oxoglutarate aldolase [Halopolyspora algeriensis]
MNSATEILELGPVVPVVVFTDTEHAVPAAQALLRGGIRTIEVTLRTPVALPALERIAAEVPDIVVGAGTITEPGQAHEAAEAGARYLVTPGCTERLLDDIDDTGLPALPGVSTASEALRLAERGAQALKFFPAEPSGGAAYLKSLTGPLPNLRFCPTGGITADNAPSYLSLPNVDCIGGSWLTPGSALAAGDWDHVEALARQAAELG